LDLSKEAPLVMGAPLDLTGKLFGRLTALSLVPRELGKPRRWLCACSCGTSVVVAARNLRGGDSKSCGCFHRDVTRNAARRRYGSDRRWGAGGLAYVMDSEFDDGFYPQKVDER
jgi:hypothetical protein